MTRTEALKLLDGLLGRHLLSCVPRPGPPGDGVVSRILLIRPGGIGDAVLLAPAVRAIRTAFPAAVIDVFAERRNAGVFLLVPQVDKVWLYDRLRDWPQLICNHYDVVIDTEQWHRFSALVARIVRAPVKIGFASNERIRLFNCPVGYSHDDYEAESFARLLGPLGVSVAATVAPYLAVPEPTCRQGAVFLASLRQRPFVVLFPGASIPERRWGTEQFRAVALSLANKGVPSVVVGGKENAAEGDKIVIGTKGLNLAGRTSLVETAAIIDKCAVLVSGDSGILHVGVGLGRPTVSLFGPGIAKKWAPRGPGHVVINKKLICSPCTRFGNTPKCHVGAQCLREITVEEVTDAVMTHFHRHLEGTSC